MVSFIIKYPKIHKNLKIPLTVCTKKLLIHFLPSNYYVHAFYGVKTITFTNSKFIIIDYFITILENTVKKYFLLKP